jgi:hypothetical protein
MKKVLLASLFIGGIALTSCNKARTCECTVSGQTIAAEFEKGKKSDQEDACTAIETTYKIADPQASCTLK